MSEDALCPDAEMEAITAQLRDDEDRALLRLDQLISDYADDARLHFLKGSVLAGAGDIERGHASIAHAVELAPGYHLARFQLGLLELSSGDGPAAQRTWAPLSELASDDFLRLFAAGLDHLIRDEFEDCRALLTHGMALNELLPEMNEDMRLVLSNLPKSDDGDGVEHTSETQMLLQSYTNSQTRH